MMNRVWTSRALFCARLTGLLAAILVVPMESGVAAATDDDRPNIIVVMADDMGFSDLGCYGGEVFSTLSQIGPKVQLFA
jgi:hypothetical protein